MQVPEGGFLKRGWIMGNHCTLRCTCHTLTAILRVLVLDLKRREFLLETPKTNVIVHDDKPASLVSALTWNWHLPLYINLR